MTITLLLFGFASIQRSLFESQVLIYMFFFISLLSEPSKIDIYPGYTRWSKALLVSFENDFGPYEREIAQSYKEVQDEASLAFKQFQKQENELQARERSKNSTHRKVLIKLSDNIHQNRKEDEVLRMEVDRRKLVKRKMEALDCLSTYNYQKFYKQIRKECTPGTSNWILENSVFKKWKEETPKILWCSGKR